jgi:hypothetical protein
VEKNRKRVGIVIPCWGRPNILTIFNKQLIKFCLNCLDKIDIICIFVLSEEDEEIKELEKIYSNFLFEKAIVYVANNPLGRKINVGIDVALQLNCNYIMNLDSDDLIHESIIDIYLPEIKKETPLFGIKSVYFWNYNTGEVYFSNNYADRFILSTGRMISREVIEKIKIKYFGIYEDNINRGLGISSALRMEEFNYIGKCVFSGNFPYIVDIKGDININNFNKVITSGDLKIKMLNKEVFTKYFKL